MSGLVSAGRGEFDRMPEHGERRESDGKEWCSGCGRWKFLVIHSCPGVWQPTKLLRADGTVERYL